MAISFGEIAKGISTTSAQALEIVTAPGLWVWFAVAFLMVAVAVVIWLWILETRKSTLIWFDTPSHVRIRRRVVSGDKFQDGDETYKLPENAIQFHDDFLGNSPAYIFLKGKSMPFKVDPTKGKLETDAEGLSKLVNNETLKQLLTIHGDAKDLILGIAVGSGVCLLVFFLLFAFKKVAFL